MNLDIDQKISDKSPPLITKEIAVDEMIAGHKATAGKAPAPSIPTKPKRTGNDLLKRYKHHYGFPEELCKTNTDEDLYSAESDDWFIPD